jgi:peroxiredoxin
MDPPAQPGALAPNLHAQRGDILAVWLEPTTDGHRLQFARWSHEAWTAPVTVVASADLVANWADTPSIVAARDGALVVHWAERAGDGPYAYHAVAARSVDRGQTWTRLGPLHPDRSATEHGFVSMVADGDAVRAFWLDGRATTSGGATSLRTALVTHAIGREELVDDRVCDCCGTAAASTTGGAVVAYRDRSEGEIRDIVLARRQADAWRGSPVHADGWQIAGCPVNGPSVAARDRRIAVAWYTYAGDVHRVRLAFSADGGATFAPPVEVDAPRGRRAALGRVAMALTDGGDAVVSWMASERDDATILVRRVSPTGALGAEVPVATTLAGRGAGFARMALAGDDLVFAWTDPPPAGGIRVARMPLDAVPRTGAMATAPAAAVATPVGSAAPELAATSLSGEPSSLASLRGSPVLLNVWATWCEPCRQELPELVRLHERYARRGLRVVAVSVDRERTREEVAAFVTKRALPFSVWLDPQDRASAAFGVATLPATFLIDRDGVIRWRSHGAVRADDRELVGLVEQLANGASAPLQ